MHDQRLTPVAGSVKTLTFGADHLGQRSCEGGRILDCSIFVMLCNKYMNVGRLKVSAFLCSSNTTAA